jgi:hypothetical protein
MHYQCRTSVREIVEGSSAITAKLVSASMPLFLPERKLEQTLESGSGAQPRQDQKSALGTL